MKIRSKICGMTRVEDALLAARLGVDAIGLIFFAGSKRHVTLQQAQAIARAVPPFVTVVGLFVNASAVEVQEVLMHVPLDVLQFHGDESSEFCRQFQRPYIKAIRVCNTGDIEAAIATYTDARALLFDAAVAGQYGGTGQTFDWQILPRQLNRPWILSGGLKPENIASAIRQSHAQAVDVSSGVEITAGIKDGQKMQALMAAINGFGLSVD
ncbi:phosphoribosylanthranilate isomerase [Snodgrassella alvi]|uniref:N-(5'-phosphoribosyl)anthranilate isomerase n=1 Tax=Snodgrassella alvi TaxID=1196083 RepID=A0A2N9WTQ6_9NEIS|nr:phosphoribosylanthranilate isomerase [Snodgrassella alvi]PIT14077.1 N-(5'-phosphoribosyl)anthranilate isomerase [Snodgrassella alvi]PIT15061.1 N-(5'-phosphoribosyl)anthranilate isomerase [Snodgrassella alvi]PIT16107.1 N-(5'-phosphoribosyl)anthranilate isomerase [Snodgrassella alvi]